MKKFVSLLIILVLALSLGVSALADARENAETYLGQALEQENKGNIGMAALLYCLAGDEYQAAHMYPEARDAYVESLRCYEACSDTSNANIVQDYIDKIDEEHPVTGSVISEGSLAIVTAVAGVAVGLVGGWFLFGRKKKTVEA